MGFVNALDARATLYRRAKFLYDFDATSDSLGISQGALLLTYYSSDREPVSYLYGSSMNESRAKLSQARKYFLVANSDSVRYF